MAFNKLFFRLISIINFFFLISLSSLGFTKTLVLVPGYFNSYAPGDLCKPWAEPYWSPDIVDLYKKAGFKVFVVNNLSPVGSIEENGELLLSFLKGVRGQLDEGESIEILAHSAGGLYTLYANHKENLPISKMLTINTPFDGVDFVERLTRDFPGLTMIEKTLNLESLNQLRPPLVHDFLQKIMGPVHFPIIAYSGHQVKNYQIWNAAYLSPIFYLTDALTNEFSDGIVTQRSALSGGGYLQVTPENEYIHLDHWKQVLKADYFTAFGMSNIEYIRQEQIRFYSNLILQLN
ncbi:MAG: esterase/lipase family protein [Pseudobdellovibrionaceae bacterium]